MLFTIQQFVNRARQITTGSCSVYGLPEAQGYVEKLNLRLGEIFIKSRGQRRNRVLIIITEILHFGYNFAFQNSHFVTTSKTPY